MPVNVLLVIVISPSDTIRLLANVLLFSVPVMWSSLSVTIHSEIVQSLYVLICVVVISHSWKLVLLILFAPLSVYVDCINWQSVNMQLFNWICELTNVTCVKSMPFNDTSVSVSPTCKVVMP